MKIAAAPAVCRGGRRKIDDEVRAEDAYKLPVNSSLSQALLQAVGGWEASKPATGAHPRGHVKVAVMCTVLQYMAGAKVDITMQ